MLFDLRVFLFFLLYFDLFNAANLYYFFPRYLQELVTAQGALERELEQELEAYGRLLDSRSSLKLNVYPTGRSNTIGEDALIIWV